MKNLLKNLLLLAVFAAGANLLNVFGAELHTAAEQGDVARVEELLNDGAEIQELDDYDDTPLHVAIRSGHENVVALLIARGADVEAEGGGEDGYETPIITAVEHDVPNIIPMLAVAGADLNMTNDNDEVPLHIACCVGSLEAVQALLAAGADVNAQVTRAAKGTPLYWACIYNGTYAQILIAAGADVNNAYAVGDMRTTPLHGAAMEGEIAAIHSLFDSDHLDPLRLDGEGRTARQIFEARIQDIHEGNLGGWGNEHDPNIYQEALDRFPPNPGAEDNDPMDVDG